MKNIHLSELMENREPVSFTSDASLKDLLISIIKNWKIHKFYITDEDNVLKGTITKSQILEYLSPIYCSMEDKIYSELEIKLSELKACVLMNKDFPSLTMKEFLPEALCQFVEWGENYLPVIDKNGHLIGEVSSDSILRTMPVKEKELLYAY